MMILTDNETKVDLLNNEAIATTIIQLMRERPDQPVTIGVHGDWGAGKSSVIEMIEAGLDGQDGVLCLKFNGWRFQGFEDAKIALIEGIVTGLIEKRSLLAKAAEAVKDILRRIDWLKVAKRVGGLAFTALTGMPSPDHIQAAVGLVSGVLTDPAKLGTDENLKDPQSIIKTDSESKHVPTEIDEFRKAFDELLKVANVERLVVLIDDLDRCLPDTAIETLEAVRLFVFTARTAFVVAADEAMIEYAVRRHFPDLPDTTGPQTYARSYLEKLIQVPFRIPALGETETRIYVTLLLVGAEIGEDNAGFIKLVAVARERLKRPWMSTLLDAATIGTELGGLTPSVQNALTLSEQIGPLLASGTRGNPRQIKRFLNTLVLRQRTAAARGFGNDVKLPVLGKLMLAERFMPRLFDQVAAVAAASPGGVCDDLAVLEAAVVGPEAKAGSTTSSRAEPRGDRRDGGATENPVEKAVLNEWLSTPSIRAWASITPALAGVDLRPYLFVTKDRKDYFGAASVLGHLVAVVEKLLGSRMAVQEHEADLKQIAPAEAMQVFDGVRARIIGGDTFDREPAGVAGLIVLVRAHPELEPNLLSFLDALPAARLGPWVLKGWEGVITTEEGTRRFSNLLQAWERDGGAVLKAAAATTRRTQNKQR